MFLNLLYASAPEFLRTICTSILIKASTPVCPSCAPQLICSEVAKCPDCICQGEIRSCPSAVEVPCPLLLTFTLGVSVGIITTLLLCFGLTQRRTGSFRSPVRSTKESSSSSTSSDTLQSTVFQNRVKYGLGSR